MKYDLGVMDIYPIAVNKTKIENSPLLQTVLREEVDAERLPVADVLRKITFE